MPVKVEEKVEGSQDLKVCLITIVVPGSSDKVLKVYPAKHEKEKIWLDNARGIERWEAVSRLLDNHAERGTRVAKPVPYHSDSKNLGGRPDLKEEDIPLVKLEGAVLDAPIEEARPDYMLQQPPNQLTTNKRIQELEAQIASLAVAISNQGNRRDTPATAKDTKEHCEICNKPFKDWKVLNRHNGRYHKDKK